MADQSFIVVHELTENLDPRKRTFPGPRWPHDVKCRELFHKMQFKQNTRLFWGNCSVIFKWLEALARSCAEKLWTQERFLLEIPEGGCLFLLSNKCTHFYGQHISHGGWQKHTCSTLVKWREQHHLSKQRRRKARKRSMHLNGKKFSYIPFWMEKEDYLWSYSTISKLNFWKITLPF